MAYGWQAAGWLLLGALLCAGIATGRLNGRHVGRVTGGWLLLLMAAQAVMAWSGGYAALRTLLPLHLCSAMAWLTWPMLLGWKTKLLPCAWYLGWPGALLALCIPVYGVSPWPELYAAVFTATHAVLVFAPFCMAAAGERVGRRDAWTVLLLANLLLVIAAVVNRALDANYLFLRYPPEGTPLARMASRGMAAYIAALEGCVLLLLKGLSVLTGRWNAAGRRWKAPFQGNASTGMAGPSPQPGKPD